MPIPPDATQDESRAAARAANAHDFIEALSEGYATILGQRAATLSRGERQRSAIARTSLKDAWLLILDEATSSADAASEADIQEVFERLMRDGTTLTSRIASRPSRTLPAWSCSTADASPKSARPMICVPPAPHSARLVTVQEWP